MKGVDDEARFLKDVADHAMAVLRDDGLYRHVRFRNPRSSCYWFDLTTWPGYLCISGDMGCYVFSRIPDMFDFFRRDDAIAGGQIHVNPGYWGEKAQAIARHGPLREYDPDLFRARVERWMEEGDWPPEAREAARREVLPRAEDSEHEAMRAALDFSRDGHAFDDFYEVNVRRVGHGFLWCCYAVAWAIAEYDREKFRREGAPQ